MPVQPVRPTFPQQPVRPSAGGTQWGVDLPPVGRPMPAPQPAPAPRPQPRPPAYGPPLAPGYRPERRPVWDPAPVPPPSRSQATNETYLNGRNLRYAIHGDSYVSIPYLSANLVDRTPEDPLDLWKIGSYTFSVKSARIDVDERQLNGAIAGLLSERKDVPVSKATVSLLDDNRVKVSARAKLGPLPIPLTIRAQVVATSPVTVNIKPETIRVFGLPLNWAVRLFRIDLAKLMKLPAGGPVAMGARGSLDVDLRKVDLFQGQIGGLGIANGRATLVLGGQPDPEVSARRRGDNPNYAEVIATGETLLDSGVIRDAKVVILDNTPQDPYSLNRWDQEGYARLEYGKVVLPEDILVSRFGSAGGEGFYLDSVKLVGADLVLKGQKEVLGLPIPVSFKVRFGNTAAGELLLTPHDVKVAGLGFGKGQIIAAMKAMPGMRQHGDGLVLDLKQASSLEMPPIRSVTAERGKVVLNT